MTTTLALGLAALLSSAAPEAPVRCLEPAVPVLPAAHPTDDERLRAFWESGVGFETFMAEATRRRALWEENYGDGEVPEALVERARAVGGPWRLLAVAVDGCSDSVNTIPYLALLSERVPGLELRIVHPDEGRPLMEARPTADGRAATPTVVLLDADYDDAGCFIERPRPLKEFIEEHRHDVGEPTLYEAKMHWYEQDEGRSTLEEVVGLLEAAAAGEPRCRP